MALDSATPVTPQSKDPHTGKDELPAAFWDTMPDAENADLEAINALKEETSPDENVETLKNQGNEAFKRGIQLKKKFYLKEAIQKYTDALEVKNWTDSRLRSAVLSNRAQTQLRLENNRSALEDAKKAAELDSQNVKAVFRGATAALRLKEFKTAESLIGKGLQEEPQAPELLKLATEVKREAKAARIAKERQAAKKVMEQAPARKLASTLLSRGWRIGAPQIASGSHKPSLDSDGVVHWPVMFMYPEAMQNDTVQDVRETDTLEALLDEMFSPHAQPLRWDTEGDYRRETIELYYLSHAATPLTLPKLTEALHTGWPAGHEEKQPSQYGATATRPVKIKQSCTLAEILALEGYIIPGVPVFFILAKGSKFRTKFLESV